MTTESPFATTRLPDLPPTTRLQIEARSWRRWLRQSWPALSVGAGLALLVVGATLLVWRPAPAASPRALLPRAARATPIAPTPPLAPPAPLVPLVVAHWAPEGAIAGAVELAGDVTILEQYRGWVRFSTSHLAQPLWAPAQALISAVPAAQLAAAAELAPTALPTAMPTAPPVFVAVEAPPAPRPDTAGPAPAAPAPALVIPTPAELQPVPPTAPALSAEGNLILEDSAERYVVQRPAPPAATAAPTSWGDLGGGGGSWED